MTIAFDPLTPDAWHDPYPAYRRLRDESPVHYSPISKVWCVSRFEDVATVLRSPELFSSQAAFDVLFSQMTSDLGWRDLTAFLKFIFRGRIGPATLKRGPKDAIIALDPPRHDARRRIVNRGFTPGRLESWRGRIDEIVADCMARFHRGERFDVVRDLAVPVPVSVIAELLGIEPERHEQFKSWSDKVVAGMSSSDRRNARPAFLTAVTEMRAYLRGVIAARRASPDDDLISLLVDPAHGETLDEAGVMEFILLLLIAGNETTTNLIGNTALVLLRQPEILSAVRENPGLIPNLIEESLRWDSPVQFVFRRATEEVEIAGVEIPENARVAVLIGSANRDERRFECPDRFEVERDAKGHLAFGFGVHFCLGASLARMEAEAALRALIPELKGIAAPSQEPEMVDSVLVRGRSSIPLERIC